MEGHYCNICEETKEEFEIKIREERRKKMGYLTIEIAKNLSLAIFDEESNQGSINDIHERLNLFFRQMQIEIKDQDKKIWYPTIFIYRTKILFSNQDLNMYLMKTINEKLQKEGYIEKN